MTEMTKSDDPTICHRCGKDTLCIDESGDFVMDPLNYAIVCSNCGWFAESPSFDDLWEWTRKPVEEKRKDFPDDPVHD